MFTIGAMRRGILGLFGAAMIFSPSPLRAGNALTTYGDHAQYVIPVIAAYAAMFKYDRDGLLQLGAASAVTIGVTRLLKNTIDSERPNGACKTAHCGKSFPSGHTASAFMGASFLHYRYGWEYGLPAYVAASAVGYSRVKADKHHWRDVIGAAAIANLSAYVLTDALDENVSIAPFTDWRKKNFGILARLRF